MTSSRLRNILLLTIVIYAVAIAAGIMLRFVIPSPEGEVYSTYKDLLPFVIAIPAAYLAFCFQRRNAYMQALRSLWTNTISAVAAARTYTDTPNPPEELYVRTLERLSVVVDECRGVFRNIPAREDAVGWFPFEPIRQIFWEIRDLGYGEAVTSEMRQQARDRIEEMWRRSREQLLAEFDRETPTFHHAQYVLPISPGHQEQRRLKRLIVRGADTEEGHLREPVTQSPIVDPVITGVRTGLGGQKGLSR